MKKNYCLILVGVLVVIFTSVGMAYSDELSERRAAAKVLPPLMNSTNVYWDNSTLHVEFEVLTYSPQDDLRFLVSLRDKNLNSVKVKTVPDWAVSHSGYGRYVVHTGGVKQNKLKINFEIDDLTQSQINELKPTMYFRVSVCNDDIQDDLGTINGYDWPNSHFTLYIPKIIDSHMNSYNSSYDKADQDYAQRYIKVNFNQNTSNQPIALDDVEPQEDLIHLDITDTAFFSGILNNEVAFSKVTLLVSGPKGDHSVFSENISGTSLDLSSYSFDANHSTYSGKAGTYYVSLWVKDVNNKALEFKWTIDVSTTIGQNIAEAAGDMIGESSGLTTYGFDPAYHNEMFRTAICTYITSKNKTASERKQDVLDTLTVFNSSNKELIYNRILSIDPQNCPGDNRAGYTEAQQTLGVRKQCKEWVDSIANDNGGNAISYSNSSVISSSILNTPIYQ